MTVALQPRIMDTAVLDTATYHDNNDASWSHLSLDSIGRIIWGLSCLFVALFMLIYDGAIKRNVQVISILFCIFLLIQTIVSAKFILMSYIDSKIISYSTAALLSFAGTIYPVICTILMLSPSHRNRAMRIIILGVIPLIYISFLFALIFIPTELQTIAAMIYYTPCAVIAFLTIIVLYRWYKTQKFIFAVYVHSYRNVYERGSLHSDLSAAANWDLLFKMAIFGVTIAFVSNFIYPLLVFYDVIPDTYHQFVIRVVDSLLFLPLITPLIRSLDQVVEYSKYRVLQYQIADSTSGVLAHLDSDSSDDCNVGDESR